VYVPSTIHSAMSHRHISGTFFLYRQTNERNGVRPVWACANERYSVPMPVCRFSARTSGQAFHHHQGVVAPTADHGFMWHVSSADVLPASMLLCSHL
jgi:hypothetical protein